jgi:hypothetical protein
MDIDHVDLYFGEPIEVKEETSLGVNIPVDPIVAEELPKKVILKKVFRRVQSFVGGFSVILSVIALIISPSWCKCSWSSIIGKRKKEKLSVCRCS